LAARTPPAKCVLDLLASLLEVTHHLIDAALSLDDQVRRLW